MNSKSIKFDLIENAKDSLSHAVEHLTTGDEITAGDYKRAILDVAHVVELILKERLRRVHPAFIWENIDKYPSPKARTVGTDVAVNRLMSLAGIALSEDYKKTLASCREVRNSIEHLEFVIEAKEARGIIGRILSFIFDFSKRYLQLDLEEDFKKDARWGELIEIHDFWVAHGVAIEKQLADEGVSVRDCPSCGALTFDLSLMRCAFCGRHEELIECDQCKQLVWESETEAYDLFDGDEDTGGSCVSVAICRSCFDREAAAENAASMIYEEE